MVIPAEATSEGALREGSSAQLGGHALRRCPAFDQGSEGASPECGCRVSFMRVEQLATNANILCKHSHRVFGQLDFNQFVPIELICCDDGSCRDGTCHILTVFEKQPNRCLDYSYSVVSCHTHKPRNSIP